MQAHSTLARLQQATTLGLLGLALAWLTWRWPASRATAVAGAIGIFFSYSLFLAAELALVKVVARGDPAPSPTIAELLRAWGAETVMALIVFFWRQPFRWKAQPDFLGADAHGRRGAVFLHGFVCNRGLWNPWLVRLRAAGHPFIAVNLEPVFASIDEYVGIIEGAVRRMEQITGKPPLLVCHSMGGLAARAWLRQHAGAGRVHRVITIGTPHRGTWLGRFSHTPNGRQMRLDGDWVSALAGEQSVVRFTCWYSNCDNVVFPPAAAMLPGADNRLVRGLAHIELAFAPQVFAHALNSLREDG